MRRQDLSQWRKYIESEMQARHGVTQDQARQIARSWLKKINGRSPLSASAEDDQGSSERPPLTDKVA